MKTSVYINASGAFMPGEPLDNDAIESRLGLIGGKKSPSKKRVLKQNQIKTRHYALDEEGKPTYRNSELAAESIKKALEKSQVHKDKFDYLATATTLGDLFLPGFASMVQGEVKMKGCEVASFHGVCASSLAALKSAYTGIKANEYKSAMVTGSEFASRHFRAEVLESLSTWKEKGKVPLDADFMRWMLSDGAASLVLENQPNQNGLSLRIDWIEQKSNADTMDTCMYAGAHKAKDGSIEKTFAESSSYARAVEDGLFILRQDLSMLEHIVPFGVAHYLDLVESGKLKTDFDWFLCHYSSHIFRDQIEDLLQKADAVIPESKWFTNLYSKGNTGSASMFIMLEELMYSGKLKSGQKIVCQVPESGRFITSFMQITVVGKESNFEKEILPELVQEEIPSLPAEPTQRDLQASLYRRLFSVWVDFEQNVRNIGIVSKINSGTITIQDYQELLLNLRQQVMEGSRWISRAASNVTEEYIDLRSMYIKHSVDEHRDFQMLEENYVATGGKKEDILLHPRNIGSEAFSGYMFHEANKENPFHLVGAMFMIEGIGNRLAGKWAKLIQTALQLEERAISFMLYHGENDEEHLQEMHEAIEMLPLDLVLVEKIVKTAKVTARLYRLQLEELGNY